MDNTTKLADLIDPEVMAPMISGKLNNRIVAIPFAKVDNTLTGQPGSTITVPKYSYIGDAEDVAEGVESGETILTATTETYTVKKAVKNVSLTDEAVLSGYGNPVGETNNQLAKSIESKVDTDVMKSLQEATLVFNATGVISYENIVNAIDLFNEEENTDKVMFIAPSQVTDLRKDETFISADKYNNNVVMTGEIGMIANSRIVPSRKINLKMDYEASTDTTVDSNKEYYTRTGDEGNYVYTKVESPTGNPSTSSYYEVASKYFLSPIVQLNPADMTDDDTAAVTIYMKRDVNLETERNVKAKKTLISADEHYVAALTDESKVVVAKFTQA